MHKLAIIIPYYKIDHFGETLKSLAGQTNKNFALYIGNDCSADDPLPLIGQYFEPHQYRYFDYNDNLGNINLALQWARILEHVTEEWFQILGDDDFVSSNLVDVFYRQQSALVDSVNVIKVKSLLCDEKGQTIKQLYGKFSNGLYEVLDLMFRKFKGGLNSSLSEHIFRLSKYQEVGFEKYLLAWHTDDMLIIRMTDFGFLLFVADAQVSVRVYEGSISGSPSNFQMKRIASKQFFFDFFELLDHGNFPHSIKRDFLKSLHQYKDDLGVKYLQSLYNKNGLAGCVHFRKYQLRQFLKSWMPVRLLKMIFVSAHLN